MCMKRQPVRTLNRVDSTPLTLATKSLMSRGPSVRRQKMKGLWGTFWGFVKGLKRDPIFLSILMSWALIGTRQKVDP